MPDVTLSDICSEHRRRYPERLAVIDGAKRYTWPQFDDRVVRAAALLAEHGVSARRPGVVVGADVVPVPRTHAGLCTNRSDDLPGQLATVRRGVRLRH